MSPFGWLLVVLLTLLALFVIRRWQSSTTPFKNEPRGPRRWPILGNLPQLLLADPLPHLAMAKLAEIYGPVMTLWLGNRRHIIVSSADVAREVLLDLHPATSHRPNPPILAYKILGHNGLDMGTHNWDSYVQKLRGITSTFFSPQQLKQWQRMRVAEVAHMCHAVKQDASRANGQVNVREPLVRASFNAMMTMLLGMRFEYSLHGVPNKEGDRFHAMVKQYFEIIGTLNMADYVPILRFFDLQGIEARTRKMSAIQCLYFEQEIEEHRERLANTQSGAGLSEKGHGPKDLCDLMLADTGPERLEGLTLLVFLVGLLFAGCFTTSVTVEWALIELLRNREVLRKLKKELDRNLGMPKADLEQAIAFTEVEEKLENLPYLNAVLKETMRRHAPGPLLIPHATAESSVMLGKGEYHIPPHTTIMINAWALAHDPSVWKEPFAFRPERFLNGEAEGKEANYVPFGVGARSCPAETLGRAMVRLMLAVLVHTFEWEYPTGPDDAEKLGLVVTPLHPLQPYAFPR
eukprot:TRINITY_DN1286_c0_g1_i1.p1 TRINITY_DN1286_c0_g1~~TRINITY_DN1286_c0_g1_i1.p1  ORF type:complete len:519 (-),score=40.49 TRINITY_DN1286_c0_g1_i1:666-2222(-)